jgi:hypothetical protein
VGFVEVYAADVDITSAEFRMLVFYTTGHTRHNQDPIDGWHTYDLPLCMVDSGATINIIARRTCNMLRLSQAVGGFLLRHQ